MVLFIYFFQDFQWNILLKLTSTVRTDKIVLLKDFFLNYLHEIIEFIIKETIVISLLDVSVVS